MNKEETDGNATLEAIYGKVENNKTNIVKEEIDNLQKVEKKEDIKEDTDEENNKIFQDKLKKHKNFDKRGQKFNKSKNRNSGNKRYETYDNNHN